MGKNRSKGIVALITLSFVVVLLGVIARFLSSSMTVFQQLSFRFFVAFILGFFIFFGKIDVKKILKVERNDWILILLRSLAFVLAGGMWVHATSLTKLANITFIDTLPMSAFFGFLLLREKITAGKVFYTFLAFFGVLIISLKNFSFSLDSFGLGEMLVFTSGILFALRNVSRRWQSTLLNEEELSWIMTGVTTVGFVMASLVFQEGIPHIPFDPIILGVILIGGFLNVWNLYLSNYGFNTVPAVLAGNLINLEAFFGVGLGFFIYHEIPTFQEFLGGALLIASVYAINRERE